MDENYKQNSENGMNEMEWIGIYDRGTITWSCVCCDEIVDQGMDDDIF